jgi:3-oxoacyl-[acyl-carrier protein] reductase
MERVLTDRVALVMGVSRRKGIGFAVADRLAEMGADVFCHALVPYDGEQAWGADSGGLEALQEELQRHGTRIEFVQADFADPSAPSAVVAAAVRAFGDIDILIANHAYSVGLWRSLRDDSDHTVARAVGNPRRSRERLWMRQLAREKTRCI